MADITPETGMLDSVRNQNLGWHIILGELIDNSFDAGANRVVIEFQKKLLRVTDDGAGCADPLKMLRLGSRSQQTTTQLGRYGIGAKDAAISAADGIVIKTTHKGVHRRVECDWRQLERSGRWQIEDPQDSASKGPSGTLIELHPLRPTKIHPDVLLRRLSRIYTPAIKCGKQILIQFPKGKTLEAVPEFRIPALTNQMTADLNVFGKQARITIGILPEGAVVEVSGITLSYAYRVIAEGQRIGLGDDPTPGLFGWVELGDGWELTKNKDNVSTNLEPLGQAIFSTCGSIIEIAKRQAANVLFDDIGKNVSDVIHSVITDVVSQKKEKRDSTRLSKGTVIPSQTGHRRRRASKVQPGIGVDALKGSGANALKVAFQHLGAGGPASLQEGNIIYLNRDIPMVAEKMNDKEALSVHAIYAASAYLAVDRQKQFPGLEDAASTTQKIAAWAGMLLSKMNRPAAQAASVA